MKEEIKLKTLSAEMVLGNLAALIEVASDIPGEYWAAENLLAERPEKWRLSFGAWLAPQLIGYAILSQRAPRHVHLHHFMVSAMARGRGCGELMAKEMFARCRAMDGEILTLKTPKRNTGAIRFYNRFGFTETDVEPGYTIMTKTF